MRWMITSMAPIKRRSLDFFWDNGVSLYESYGVTEAGLIAWNKPGAVKRGTVGRPIVDGELVLTEQGEVVIRSQHPLCLGYFDVGPEDEREVFRDDGIATGDIAHVDDEGYVTLVGRIKNAIVTAHGKKFHPEQVEAEFESKIPTHVPVILGGADVCENSLLLAPRNADDVAALSRDFVASTVRGLNEVLEPHKQVRAVYLLDQPFSVASGFMTRSLKLDRRKIQSSFLTGQFKDKQVSLAST